MFSLLSRRRVAMLLVLTCLLLITLDRNGNPVIDAMRRGFAAASKPFEQAAEAATIPVKNAWRGVTSYDELQTENAALRDEIQRQRGAAIENETNALEYYELLDLLGLTSAGQFNSRIARVIGKAPSDFQNTVEIDKGASSGIQEGMPVIDGAGLVGKVTQVFADQSIVLLITDPRYFVPAAVYTGEVPPINPPQTATGSTTASGIPVDDLESTTTRPTSTNATPPANSVPPTTTASPPKTTSPARATTSSTTTSTLPPVEVIRETGSVQGQGGSKPVLFRFLDDAITLTQLKVGSTVRTSGGSQSLAPPGIPIGKVSSIERQSGSRSPVVEVTPYTELDQLNFVAVVLFVPAPDS